MTLTNRQKKIIIGLVVIIPLVGYLFYTSMRDTMVYYLTVSEVLAKGESLKKEGFRIAGRVAKNSIERDTSLKLKFEMEDEKTLEKITVLYEGIVPDTFKEDVTAIVEGKLTENNIFKAKILLAKCPSKYEAKKN